MRGNGRKEKEEKEAERREDAGRYRKKKARTGKRLDGKIEKKYQKKCKKYKTGKAREVTGKNEQTKEELTIR